MKIINRNNYEEFFLLYTDGELNAEQQLAVENFMSENADLAVELEMLMQTKLTAEIIEFADKENLLRTEGNNINETNYEEYFLLYIDNELSAAKRKEVETYVLQHPKLQNEFITLKHAVLAPEIISFGDKTNLYRTERRRTVYLKPWRLAAAAILVGVCAIGFWLMQKSSNSTVRVSVNQPVQEQPKQNKPRQENIAVKPEVDSIQKQIRQQPVITAQQSSPKKEVKKTVAATAIAKKKKENKIISKPEDNAIKDQPNETAIERPLISHNTIVKQQKEPPEQTQDVVNVPEHISQKQNNTGALQTPVNNNENTNTYKIYPVAYKEINTNDEDRSLRVGMLDLNKTKVKNLFKKAGRMFGNKSTTSANDDGKLQVANFEIETKKQ